MLKSDPGVAFATPGHPMVGADGTPVSPTTWSWVAFPKTAAQDQETRDLVSRLRGGELNAVGASVLVGGFTAGGIDFSTYIVGSPNADVVFLIASSQSLSLETSR